MLSTSSPEQRSLISLSLKMEKALTLVSIYLPSAFLLLHFYITSYHRHLQMQTQKTFLCSSRSVFSIGQRTNALRFPLENLNI